MKLIIKLIFLAWFILNNVCEVYTSEDPHPYGQANKIISVNRKNDKAELVGDFDVINRIFLHPQVKDRKIVVFSIIGAYREGKSFFLDYCLRYLYATYGSVNSTLEKVLIKDWMGDANATLQGFSWKHGSTADTKGLMIWNDVFLYDAPSGEKIAIVIFDTQGLFEPHSPDEENAKIFSLATLISSIQIMNTKETIKENQISHLQSAIDLTNLITNKQNNSEWKPFQNLLFLMRDFEDDAFGYGYGGGQKYFDRFFSIESLGSSIESRSNVNRKSILQSFDSISCFLLPHPGLKVKKKFFKGQWGLLEDDFKENLKILIESILSPGYLAKKTVLGNEVTSAEFQNLFTNYLKAYGTFEMPKIEGLLEASINAQMGSIINEQLRIYQDSMNEKIIYDRENFIEWTVTKHETSKNFSVQGFLNSKKIQDNESEMKFKSILESNIEDYFKHWNETTIKTFMLMKSGREIQEIISSKLNDYQLKINEDVDFKIDNFTNSIDEKNENLSKVLITEFIDDIDKYKDILNVNVSINNFLSELDKNYKSWRAITIKSFEEDKMKNLVNEKLNEHQRTILGLKEYNQDDYESFFNTTYGSLKDTLIEQFLMQSQNFRDVEIFKNILLTEIDNRYDELMASKIRDHENYVKMQKSEMAGFVQKSSYFYYKLADQNVDFNVSNFEDYINERHENLRNQTLEYFLDTSSNLSKYQHEYTKFLEADLENAYATWRGPKLREYEENQRKRREMVEREMEILISSYSLFYEKNMTDGIVLNATNFEKLIDEKHKTIKFNIIANFKLDSLDGDLKYVDNLDRKIEEIFLNLRQKKIRESETIKAIEQNLLDKGVEILIDELIQNYVQEMNKEIDYDKQNFFSWFEIRHNDTKNKINEVFISNSELQRSIKKADHIIRMNKKLSNAYENEKGMKKLAYNLYEEQKRRRIEIFLDKTVDEKVEEYKESLLEVLDFDRADFKIFIVTKHEDNKKKVINEFEASLKHEHQDQSVLFKDKLKKIIDKHFRVWKSSTLKEYETYQERKRLLTLNEMRNIKRRKFNEYKTSLIGRHLSEDSYLSSNFESNLNSIHYNATKSKIDGFRTSVKHYNDSSSEDLIASELNEDIDEFYVSWKREKQMEKARIEEKKEKDNDRILDEYIYTLSKQYEVKMSNPDYERRDFKTFIALRHQNELKNAKDSLESKYNQVKSKEFSRGQLEKLKDVLENKILKFFNDYEKKYVKKHEDLGVWVYWNTDKNYLPPFTVGDGYNEHPLYVGRIYAAVGKKNINVGNLVGHYDLNLKRFYAAYDGDDKQFNGPFNSNSFEILTHKNYKWVDYTHGGTKILGAVRNGNNEYICRAELDDYVYQGRLEGRICRVAHGSEYELDEDYEILVLGDA